MKEVIDAIQRHLGRQLQFDQLDYYQVIGLELYCGDERQLREALQRATNTWMQSETGRYPESSQIVAKLLKQAQAILLDPKKRSVYDKQLAKLRATTSSASSSARAKSSASAPTSTSIFPDGDPMQPFLTEGASWSPDTSAPTAVLLARYADVETRRAELEQLFPSLAELEASAASPWNAIAPPERKDAPKSAIAVRAASEPVALREQIRRRRRRNQTWVAGAMILASLGLLIYATLAFVNNRSRMAAQDRSGRDPRAAAPIPTPADARAASTRPLTNGAAPPDRSREANPRVVSNLPSVRRNEESNDVGREASSDDAEKPSSAPMDSASMESTPAGPESTVSEPAPEPKPAPQPAVPAPAVPAPDEPATPADVDAWKERMRRARAAIDQRDFPSFEKEIEPALSDAPSAQAKEQAKRLDQLGQLLKIYLDSIPESKKKAKGASSLKVGSAEVSIVESKQDKLIVRAGGKNQTYEWNKLPFGIAVALSDLSLSPTEPIDVAARAVYFSLDPFYRKEATSNRLIAKKVDEWFEKSAGKGQVRADLRQALTDSYE